MPLVQTRVITEASRVRSKLLVSRASDAVNRQLARHMMRSAAFYLGNVPLPSYLPVRFLGYL